MSRGASLAARFRCEPRFTSLRVPTIELWVAGPPAVFHRMAGVVDSGAAVTLLGRGAYELLGVPRGSGTRGDMPGLTGQLKYELCPVQMRLHLASGPDVTVWVRAGFCEQIEHNLFGSDLLDYFNVLVSRNEVTFMAR